MNRFLTWRRKRGFFTGIAIGTAGVAAIIFLAQTVARDMRLLDSASSDNLQWALAQSEVEFMEFDRYLAEAEFTGKANLPLIRRRFDIFYSRVSTMEQSSIFADLRTLPEFVAHLSALRRFLDDNVGAIDGDDQSLAAAVPAMRSAAVKARTEVRGLSNSGLDFFARDADRRRKGVAISLLQLAGVMAVLMLLLVLLAAYLGYLNSVTQKRRNEIAQANDRLNIVIQNSLEGVIVADKIGCILDFNAAAEKIFGYTAEEAIGCDLGDLVVPDHLREQHTTGMKRLADGGERRVVGKGRVRLEAKRANGEVFPVELAVQSARTEDGEVFVAFMRDLSPEVKAEAELVAARDRALAGEKAKTDFLAVMSHEIRTPLNGLLGNLSLLEDTPLDGKQRQFVTNMETSGRLLMSHISDVLDLTKYDSDAQALRPVNMDLSGLIQDIVDSQSGAATAQKTGLSWGWRGQPVSWIKADRERIQHILTNLIGNAVKFTHGGEVVIVAETTKTGQTELDVRISVRDTGIGIDDELKDRIFDDFVTGDASYVRKVGGTGLGLGIARRLVEGMAGEIGVESEKGEGSEFWIRFPAETVAESSKSDVPDQKTSPSASLDILLVEDNDINLFVAREMLAKAGHNVTVAHNGQESVESAAGKRFDLIFMDISMPVMDGPTATRLIRSGGGLSADVPIVALTANVMANEQKAFLANGMNAILTKPLTRDTLAAMVSQFGQVTQELPAAADTGSVVPAELQGIVEEPEYRALVSRLVSETREFSAGGPWGEHPDFPAVRARAHNLAGSAAFLAAKEMHGLLITLENAAGEEDADTLNETHTELMSLLSRMQD